MAIRNTDLGGATNWGDEILTATDLNDTMNAAVAKIQTLTAFWLSSDLYDVKDDFESYSVGNFASQGNWTVTLTSSAQGTETSEIASSTNAGGTGKELKLVCALSDNANYQDGSTTAVYSLTPNKHVFFRAYMLADRHDTGSGTYTGYSKIYIGNSTDGYFEIADNTGAESSTISLYPDIMIVAKGSNIYDVYNGFRKIDADRSLPNGLSIKFAAGYTNSFRYTYLSYTIYVDDIRQSKTAI